MKKIVIIGAGLTGLSTGYHAKQKNVGFELYEQESCVGGLCRTIENNGFYFDYSGHLLYLKNSYFQSLVRELLGDNINIIQRNSFIYFKGIFTRYPFQVNLYGLPPKVLKECLMEFVKAFYERKDLPTASYKTFYDWIVAKLGKGIGKHFMFPYNEKVWTVPTEELTCEWLSEYVPMPALEDVFNGSFFDQEKNYGYNATFWYPKTGGIQALCDAFAKQIQAIKLNEKLVRINLQKKVVEFVSGKNAEYGKLISTMPLEKLVKKLSGNVPAEVTQAAQKLRHNSLLILNLGVKGNGLTNKHWIYLPEKKYTAYRIGIYSNFSESMAPPGTSSYYVEIAYQKDWNINKEQIIERAINEIIEMGFIRKREDILLRDIVDIECAYVIYDKYYSVNRKVVMNYLNKHDIYSIGRYGNWEYTGMEEAMIQGKRAIDSLS